MAKAEQDPGLPIKVGPASNGEFYPPPPNEIAREAARRTRALSERAARRRGISRREFLLSSAGSAAMLSILAACSEERSAARSSTTTAGRAETSGPGGTYSIPEDATTDDTAAQDAIGGDEFVFDVQGHFLEYPENTPLPVPDLPQASCDLVDKHDCFDLASFIELIFGQSDTAAIMLSAIPFGDALLSPDLMKQAIEDAERLCGTGRVFMQGQANPSAWGISTLADAMTNLAENYPVRAWKAYTHAGGAGWYLDDRDPDAPQVGQAFIDQARSLDIPIIAVHKGLNSVGGNPANQPYSDPVDVGPAAAANPDINFVIYHSGFDFGPPESAYSADNDHGIDRLIRSVTTAKIAPGSNVYAELGSTWRFLMTDPTAAAHALGKLLVTFGEDRVVWGTDSIWYGSPQDQIEAFRAFEITPEFQERFGYPALTSGIKAKILGLNSADLYGIDPAEVPCALDPAEAQELRVNSGTKNRVLGPTTRSQVDALQH
jgi:predicted TIM-barrel fold metal-dependent hydrolase